MRATILFCVFCLLSLTASTQGLKVGAQGGLQVSTFPTGVARFGWKGNAVAAYELNRFRFSEQIGVTMDKCSSAIPIMSTRNYWRYTWADATTIVSYIPFRTERFDVSLGSGISIRRIISNTLNGNPNTANEYDTRIHKWSYFLPARIGANFHLEGGREIACTIEYQYQLREMYAPREITHPWDELVNKLHSVNLSVAYLFKI